MPFYVSSPFGDINDDELARRQQAQLDAAGGAAQNGVLGALKTMHDLAGEKWTQGVKEQEIKQAGDRLALEQAREDRIAAFGRGHPDGLTPGGKGSKTAPGGGMPSIGGPDGLPAPLGPNGQPMSLDDAGDALPGARPVFRRTISTSTQSNDPKVMEQVNRARKAAGLDVLSPYSQASDTPDMTPAPQPSGGLAFDVYDQGADPGTSTEGAAPGPDVRDALRRTAGSAETDATMATEDEQKKRADLDRAKANAIAAEKRAAKPAAVARVKPPKGSITGPTGDTGKPLSPKDLNDHVAVPRRLIQSLDELITAAPELDTGARATAEDAAGHIPIVGEYARGKLMSQKQADFESKIHSALAGVNNAMDRRVSEPTLRLWTKQVVDAAKRGPEAYAASLRGIQEDLRKRQDEYESELKASGYLVPGGGGASKASAAPKRDLSKMSAADLANLSDDELKQLAGGG